MTMGSRFHGTSLSLIFQSNYQISFALKDNCLCWTRSIFLKYAQYIECCCKATLQSRSSRCFLTLQLPLLPSLGPLMNNRQSHRSSLRNKGIDSYRRFLTMLFFASPKLLVKNYTIWLKSSVIRSF